MASNKKGKGGKAAGKKVLKGTRVERHGIRLPTPGTIGDRIFTKASSLTKQKGRPATRAEVIDACVKAGISQGSAMTGFQQWRTFNGYEGRLTRSDKGKPRKAAAKKASGAAKPAAKKAAAKKPARKAPAKKAPVAAPAPAAAEAAAAG